MNDAAAKSANGQQAGARPAVLSLSIKEKAALYAAYMPYLKNGGIFVPTTRPYQLGDDVYLILTLLDDSTRIPVAGKVVWVSPAAGGKVPRGGAASAQYRRPLLTAAGASRDTKGKVREDGRVMRLIV